eukprot:Gregarina_sp_Poly_1__4018@NODE_2215_length_2477_cov_33_977593_g1429_i0_p1_GENE_NODE_2215_length_2477_cov_33_977593_g1429_i0NODE_2215_length_2477_cov_33_977593_g1429_i0_p1_ORF_typecomplete_len158_score21_09HTH_26/PF13443_6/3_9HTH_26/PF13443_6/87HTH_26/PF13443_6/3_1e03AcylCoA_ox_N/PF14749_6/0_075_NODE_2215_length_2477_cov_33_977593_g1429_i011121585
MDGIVYKYLDRVMGNSKLWLPNMSNGNFCEEKYERINRISKALQSDPASLIDRLKPLPRTDEYRKDLAEFLHRSRYLNAIENMTDLIARILDVDFMTDLLEFCDDALDKAATLVDKCEFEPLIMQLAYIRSRAILSLIHSSNISLMGKGKTIDKTIE